MTFLQNYYFIIIIFFQTTQKKNYIEEDDIIQSHFAVCPVFVSISNTDAATTIG